MSAQRNATAGSLQQISVKQRYAPLAENLSQDFDPYSSHDGMVAVEETRIAGAKDLIELHLAHTTMLFSTKLAELVGGFLKEGKFVR